MIVVIDYFTVLLNVYEISFLFDIMFKNMLLLPLYGDKRRTRVVVTTTATATIA